jgi:hypothetical protein
MNNVTAFHPKKAIRPPYPPITGCPVVFTKDTNDFKCENNMLNESTFPVNLEKDIVDKIVIENTPYIDTTDNTIQFAVTETSHDSNYFDNFVLSEVIHPDKYSAAITENDDLVLINPEHVRSPKYAENSGTDVTIQLAFDSAFYDKLKGEDKDIVNARFDISSGSRSKEKLITEIQNSI